MRMRNLAAAALAVALPTVGLNACKGVSPLSFHESMEAQRTVVIRRIISCNIAISYNNALGSGVVYRKDGKLYALTAAHVVEDEPTTVAAFSVNGSAPIPFVTKTHGTKDILVFAVEENGTNVYYACKADIVLVVPEEDIAVLQLQEIPGLVENIGNSTFDFSTPTIGERVFAVGNTSFEIGTLSAGIVQHGNRKPAGSTGEQRFVQSDCAGGPGMSGGGLFLQSTGECIGIVSMKSDITGSIYAIPMSKVKTSILNSLRKDVCPD
jgi:S1-C subfamily serine protease